MRRARATPAADAAFENEIGDDQSVQDEIPLAPRRRGRGRGRGRARAVAAQQPDQPPPEPKIPAVDLVALAMGMAGINQGLAALNQAIPLMQQMLQQRDQWMTDVDAALLYSRVGRVYFDGTGDALDFVNTIESSTRTRYSDYQRIMVVEISVSAAAQDWFMQSIQPYMTTMTWADFRERFMRFSIQLQ